MKKNNAECATLYFDVLSAPEFLNQYFIEMNFYWKNVLRGKYKNSEAKNALSAMA